MLTAVGLGAGYLAAVSHARTAEAARLAQLEAKTAWLVGEAESLIAEEAYTELRQQVVTEAHQMGAERLRLVWIDGAVLADRDPTQVVRDAPPAVDAPAATLGQDVAEAEGVWSQSLPVRMDDRVVAWLEVTAEVRSAGFWSAWLLDAGLLVGGLGLIGVVGIDRWTRRQYRTATLIRDGLRDLEASEREQEVLRLSEAFGAEAETWNRLLDELGTLRQERLLKKADQDERRRGSGGSLKSACEAIESGMILIDDEMRVTYSNGAAAAFLQRDAQGCIGTPLHELIDHEGVVDAARRATVSRGYSRGIVEVDRRESGGDGVLRFVTRPSRRSDQEAAIVIIEDITQQRVAQEAHSAFLAQAAHELRTPLTNIRLHIDTAIEHGEKDPATRDECLNTINSESFRLERVVQDMLSVSEIEAGAMSLHQDDVQLERIMKQVEKDHGPQAAAKKQKLVFDLSPKLPVLRGDQDKLLMAIHNLVGNAIKYTPEDGRVTVEAEVDGERVVIRVVDTGIGIKEENLGSIFDRFFRTDEARTAGITGTGLGLGLARDIARLHGGDIEVTSIIDEGSTFVLSLPLTKSMAVVAG
ncbi:sensor histidine kinase [Mucisphaera sp.]|uniref:sensor histidine kinase n=1 Tax=Mucisphaera sp. TaxID=2913024 RepID=UPI003D0BD9F9